MKTYLVHRQKKGIVSFLIRKFTKSWSSHTALLIDGFIFESDKGYVRMLSYENWCSNSLITVDLIPHKNDVNRIAVEQLGKKYDFKGTIVDWFIYILFGKWTGYTGIKSTDKFYCSEYVAYCLSYENYYKTSPAMLYNNQYNRIFVGIDKNFKIK